MTHRLVDALIVIAILVAIVIGVVVLYLRARRMVATSVR